MPSAPTTSFDLSSPAVVADPYPFFAEERAAHPVAWHEGRQLFLTFSHEAVSRVQRERTLGRIWHDREPLAALEPFNLLHRNQMMENEPPEHTRLRRPVARAFSRGHIERLRPRVRSLAAELLAEVDPAGFDVISQYAEPLPVLVIAELLGVPAAHIQDLRAGRRRSCGCTRSTRHLWSSTRRSRRVDRLRRAGPRPGRPASAYPRRRPDHRPGRHGAHRRRGGRRGGAAAQRRPRGVGQRLRQRPGRHAAARAATRCRRARGRSRRCCASTRPSSSSSAPPPRTSRSAAWSSSRARRSPRCSARRTATRPSSPTPTSSTSTATPTRTWPSGSACTSAWAHRWPGWSWRSRWLRCSRPTPTWGSRESPRAGAHSF